MDSDIFSADPKSFKIHRKSPLAKKLKSFIIEKLRDFLGNYTDDVLAEYITVVVCNGKHQYQARDDLEAFLGDSSTEFVSWLWNFLVKQNYESDSDTGHCPKDVIIPNSDRVKDSRLDGLKDIDNSDVALNGGSVTKGVKLQYTNVQDTVHSDEIKQASGIQQCPDYMVPSSEVNAKEVFQQPAGQEGEPPTVHAAKSTSGSLVMHDITRNMVSSVVSASAEQRVLSTDNKLGNGAHTGLPNQPLHVANKELFSRNLRSVISEDPLPRQLSMKNVRGRSPSPRSTGVLSGMNDRSRVSVWDRLGKPSENISIRDNKNDAQGVNIAKKDFPNECVAVHPLCSGKVGRNVALKVPRLASTYGDGSCPIENSTSEEGTVLASDPHVASNISRKRHFGKIDTAPASGSNSVMDPNKRYLPHKETSNDFKKTKATTGDPKAASSLVSEVLDVKQRLHQMEEEMSKLRSKQVEMKKDGKADPSSHCGNVNHQEEDTDSRTIFVTNVHYAASREALSLYFAKCGAVVNVVTLTDKATGQAKGSAYVTFSSKESVDKALALSGSSFFSRIIKVVRKAEAAAVASPVSQLPGKPYEVPVPYTNKIFVPSRPSHLQWRRESSNPSKPSAPTREEKGTVTSAS